jgi:hypothetical protein
MKIEIRKKFYPKSHITIGSSMAKRIFWFCVFLLCTECDSPRRQRGRIFLRISAARRADAFLLKY